MGQRHDTATIEITTQALELLQRAVTLGDYASPSDLIEDALQSRAGADLLGYSLEELRQLGDEGEASGPGRSLSIEAIHREALRLADEPAREA